MVPSSEDLKETMRGKTDWELYRLLHVHSQDYTPEALRLAGEEFSSRHLDEQAMSRIGGCRAEGARRDARDGRGSAKACERRQRNSDRMGCLILLCLLCLVGYAIYYAISGGYKWLDSIGWITHNHDTPVWIQGDWMIGEYRNCDLLTTTPMAGSAMSEQVRAELPRLFCGRNNAIPLNSVAEFENATQDIPDAVKAVDGDLDWSAFDSYFHVLPVLYCGRIDRPDTWDDFWRCQRLSGSLECKALN